MRMAIVLAIGLTSHQAAADNHCELTISGESSASIKADAPATIASRGKLGLLTDYWLSDAEIRTGVGVFAGIDIKESKADKDRKIDAAMKKDPRFMLFVLNCLTDEGGAIFSAALPSKYADFPMKQAAHAIVDRSAAKAGDVIVLFQLSPGGKRERYAAKGPGKLVLTQLDKKGVAGTFSFKAEARDRPKHIDVAGKFSYACSGSACQK